MSREEHSGAPETWRPNLRLKAGIMLGAVALFPAASVIQARSAEAAPESYGIGLVGFTDNSIFTENLADAETAAARIVQMGGTAVRFIYPLNKGTAWENYTQETCNAFQAAHDHGLQPIVSFRGYDGQPGYVPQSPTEIKQFKTTAASIMWTVASKKDGEHPGGCVPDQTQFIFEGINEINNGMPFNRNLGVNTPAQAAIIDSQLSSALTKEAAKPELQVSVSFGESLAAGSHDPVQFMHDEAKAANTLGIKLNYKFVDIHPYPKTANSDPSATMQALYQPAKDAINALSPGAQLTFGEYGVNTINPPADEALAYTPPVSSAAGVNESAQVKYVTDFLKTAASEGVPWVTLFDVQDDGSGYTPSSGEFYVSGNPKSSQPAIRYQIGKYTGR